MIIYLRDFDSVILGQAWNTYLKTFPWGFWDSGVWGHTELEPLSEGPFQNATSMERVSALLLKTLQGLVDKAVRASCDKK